MEEMITVAPILAKRIDELNSKYLFDLKQLARKYGCPKKIVLNDAINKLTNEQKRQKNVRICHR